MADRRGISGRPLARLGNSLGAPVFVLHYNSSTSTGTSNTDTVVNNTAFRMRILRAWFRLTEAAAGDSEDVKLTDGTNDITDTADYSAGADNDTFEFSSYDNAYTSIAKGGQIQIVKTATTAVTSFDMYIMCVREDL